MNWTWFWLGMTVVLLIVQQIRINRKDDRIKDMTSALIGSGKRSVDNNKLLLESHQEMFAQRKKVASLLGTLAEVRILADPFSTVAGEPPFSPNGRSPNGRLKSIREVVEKATK